MYFLYKTRKFRIGKGEYSIVIELYDFILGKVIEFEYDSYQFVTIEQHIFYKLKYVKMPFEIRKV